MKNKTILQNFEWYLPNDGQHWKRTAQRAGELAALGFTDIWMPPAFKGSNGINDVGYGVYDLYDLGEFYQKGAIRTKYGTKDAYLEAIEALHGQNLRVIGDIVLNHRMGADAAEDAVVNQMDPGNRLNIRIPNKPAKVHTQFFFPGRNGRYSTFVWNKAHFNGVDYDGLSQTNGILQLLPNGFNPNVGAENDSYDYLMGCNHDVAVPEVREELIRWGRWYMDFTGLDGVRLDSAKHIDYTFLSEWVKAIRERADRDVFAVGEYWSGDTDVLSRYLERCGHCMSLFDVPLHYLFHYLSSEHTGKLTALLSDTLMAREPDYAVTFVDNVDTQPGQALESWVKEWFKPLAYAIILLRKQGTPCVFYGDLYGIPTHNIPPVAGLDTMLKARQRFAYGEQVDYVHQPHTVGWTRRGGPAGDLAVAMTNGGDQRMYMELGQPGEVYVDLLGNRPEAVTINSDGWGCFTVNKRSVSVWVRRDQADI